MQKKKVVTRKGQPTGSDVHVPSPVKISRRVKKDENLVDLAPSVNNLEASLISTALSAEGIGEAKPLPKDVATAAARRGYTTPPDVKPIAASTKPAVPTPDKKDPAQKDKLSTKGRKHIKETNFALPAERKYPINDISHARNALSRSSGKPEEAKVKAAVYRKYPSLKPIQKDDAGTDQELGGMGDNALAGLYDMQQIISGMDYEMEANKITDPDIAKEDALANLSDDADYYRKKWAEKTSSDTPMQKDSNSGQQSSTPGEGLSLDLGSGQCREPGYLGLDTYPYDHGTIVHDLTLGLPFPDQSATNIRMVNAMHEMDADDQKPLLSEIQRVLMPGGEFHYEGPNEIYNYPEWLDETAKSIAVHKIEGGPGWVKQKFTRVAMPDAATADDSEPRVGIAQYDMLPADALLAMDAMGYYWSDATSSGRGNRLHGYPSQGGLVSKIWKKIRGIKPEPVHMRKVPIAKLNKAQQIVYCVVLSPNESDLQDDIMDPEDIEKTAHEYLMKSRVIGSNHEKPIDAMPVESYIAPQDIEWDGGQYGPQIIKKGAWVLGIKVLDPGEWEKIENGDYQGVSVGGLGLRDKMATTES